VTAWKVPTLTEEEWITLGRLREILHPWALATAKLSSDQQPTSAIVWPVVFSLFRPSNQADDADVVHGFLHVYAFYIYKLNILQLFRFSRCLRNNLQEHWDELEERTRHLYLEATLLHPCFKYLRTLMPLEQSMWLPFGQDLLIQRLSMGTPSLLSFCVHSSILVYRNERWHTSTL